MGSDVTRLISNQFVELRIKLEREGEKLIGRKSGGGIEMEGREGKNRNKRENQRIGEKNQ